MQRLRKHIKTKRYLVKTTTAGRVVYNRKTKFFKAKDIVRILDSMNINDFRTEEDAKNLVRLCAKAVAMLPFISAYVDPQIQSILLNMVVAINELALSLMIKDFKQNVIELFG